MDALFNSVHNGAIRISDIVKGLRSFTHLDEAEIKTVNLEDGLNDTLSILSEKLNERIRVVKDFGNIPPVRCLASEINQVFMNLIDNAIDAIEGDGEIRIQTKKLDGNKVRISIKDTGKGIPENIKSRIFDPFFTTKEVGKGTGLGLSISYNIIKKHKGAIYINTAPGHGTEFIVELDEYCMIGD
jgi:signal transduction histidine kinase